MERAWLRAGSAQAVRRLEEIERALESLAGELLQKAEAADVSDTDGGGTQLPRELCDPQQRQRKLLAAKATILARRQAARAAGRRDEPPEWRSHYTATISEPESRRLGRRGGRLIQGYNVQALIDARASGLI